jgi:hypothetical protein
MSKITYFIIEFVCSREALRLDYADGRDGIPGLMVRDSTKNVESN